ncbi:DMT family transporter [Streptomyces sp. P01-B04]|uniref:DMT family transporter n=1 Tax=Streptomyces poriferorum TaxID=2798799 RepID=UPI001C6045E7|nr:DMT family transporter [Streptomyces poriferorum]MBW5252195.1 DMT family transporter [Streptomyces poriferorum]MBW5260289.1 DMT family transporter [Streptomyces poriferorum]
MVYMSSLALSVLLSLVSAVAYAAGAIVQERVATASDGRSLAPLRNRVWWAAVALNGVGAVLHVVALAYGPLSLVQPLGALTIVFALPMAALFVRRRAGATAWRGALMATVGLAGLLALTGGSDAQSLGGPEQLMLAIVTFGAVAALMLVAKAIRRPVIRSVVLAGAAGVAFGIASVFTKTVAMQWTSGEVGAGLPTLLVIAALAGAGLLLSQAAYRGAGLTAPLATVTVVNPVVAAAVGITLFGEQFRHGTAGTLLALACGAVAAGGLIMLTTERMSAERRESRRTAVGEHPQGDAHAGQEPGGATVAARPPGALPVGASGEDAADFAGPAGSPDPAGAPNGPAGTVPRPVRATTPTVVAFPEPVAPTPAAAAGTYPTPLPVTVRKPLERRVGRAEFGPDPRPPGGGARRGASSTGSTASAAAAGDRPGIQTLTPPALR